jgi:hypothetical protein
VGGLAASSPAVLGDRRCWFSGEEICSADGLEANGVPALVVNKIERKISWTLRVMRAATEALRFPGVRILANFKHFRDVECASGKCPHLAIRDRLNLGEERGRNITVARTRSCDAQERHQQR